MIENNMFELLLYVKTVHLHCGAHSCSVQSTYNPTKSYLSSSYKVNSHSAHLNENERKEEKKTNKHWIR